MATIGLRLALTFYGIFDVVIPELVLFHRGNKHGHVSLIAALAAIHFKLVTLGHSLQRTRRKVLKSFRAPDSPLLSLPFELREQIYDYVCAAQHDGLATGSHHLLLLNKQIRREALPFYERISHKIVIADLLAPSTPIECKGLPYLVNNEWFMSSLKHLVIEISVCSLGTMTPDSFDVNISSKGKEQWRSLKKLIGIWPEVRDEPLQSIRLDLKRSRRETKGHGTYRADFIRILRNFKRTRIWAETGDCASQMKRKSVLLPLVRAFNQGRRNWVKDSDSNNNLIVRYDKQVLLSPTSTESEEDKEDAADDEELEKWNVIPVADTSRTDNAHWPEWTNKEEKYVSDKMVPRKTKYEQEWECKRCLAVFDCPRELREHKARNAARFF